MLVFHIFQLFQKYLEQKGLARTTEGRIMGQASTDFEPS